MGYTTEFSGQISIEPALNAQEIAWVQAHNYTRRMKREKGAYYVDSKNDYGQDHETDIIDYNQPPEKDLSLWCQWTCTDDGTRIEWDGGEKFYSAAEWMRWLIVHILGSNPFAKKELPFLQGHMLNGEIFAQGEDSEDLWVEYYLNGKMQREKAVISYEPFDENKLT